MEDSYNWWSMQRCLLEAVADEDGSTMADIRGLLACTLAYHQLQRC